MTLLRWAAGLGLLVVGAVTAVAAIAVHTLWWGLPLVAVALAAAMVGLGRGWLTRLPFAVGFVALVGLALPRRSEGDYVIASGAPGWLLLLLALLTLLVALVTLPRPRRVAESVGVGPRT